ncbi:glycosyltransferase family A protein [Fructilactobacillus sanfranciscensis]|uniref:glycosyltransferase family A protein n=1 Tax=Fructilactobacillus sanfranciscensis TaxID=1625 RepID=UPI0031F98789
MSNKILTISVAAYNVEKTLSKTLDSFNDSRIYDDVEVLIIDDGSKDKTKDIAEKYEKLVPQMFKYIKKVMVGMVLLLIRGSL